MPDALRLEVAVDHLRHAAAASGPRLAPSEEFVRQAARGTFY